MPCSLRVQRQTTLPVKHWRRLRRLSDRPVAAAAAADEPPRKLQRLRRLSDRVERDVSGRT